MNVHSIIRHKGAAVESVPPDTLIADVVDRLSACGIGALVVSSDGRSVDGIVSERDVVRGLARNGASLLDSPVAELMTREVRTCTLGDTVTEVMTTMTERRFRHMPVVEDGALAGIVSIGDLVKSRLAELEAEANHLRDYITH